MRPPWELRVKGTGVKQRSQRHSVTGKLTHEVHARPLRKKHEEAPLHGTAQAARPQHLAGRTEQYRQILTHQLDAKLARLRFSPLGTGQMCSVWEQQYACGYLVARGEDRPVTKDLGSHSMVRIGPRTPQEEGPCNGAPGGAIGAGMRSTAPAPQNFQCFHPPLPSERYVLKLAAIPSACVPEYAIKENYHPLSTATKKIYVSKK